jgi:hypothetical protein
MKAKLILVSMTGVLIAIGVVRAQEPSQEQGVQQSQDERSSVASRGAERDFFFTELSRIQRGFAIAPVQLRLRGKNLALVGLGSYLVNGAGGCNDCHTNPPYAVGGDPFLGQPKRINADHYLAGGVAFGPFTSRNITPDENGLPAGLTYEQFRQVMRTGIDLDQEHPQISPLLQVMPWPVFQNLVERDLRAIYEYLSAIPHAEPGT